MADDGETLRVEYTLSRENLVDCLLHDAGRRPVWRTWSFLLAVLYYAFIVFLGFAARWLEANEAVEAATSEANT